MKTQKEPQMRHVTGFSNSTKIRYIVNGFGMYGTVNDLFTKTATVSHGDACVEQSTTWLTFAGSVPIAVPLAQLVLASRTKASKFKLI